MRILLYTRRNVGLYCLSHLVALGHEVVVMTDDENVNRLADKYGCPVVENGAWEVMPTYELFLSVHGGKIIPSEFLRGLMVNVHPCLDMYPGKDPIARYIKNKNIFGSISSHYIIDKVDEGEVIYETPKFLTGVCLTHADFYNIALPFYYRCLDETLNRILK